MALYKVSPARLRLLPTTIRAIKCNYGNRTSLLFPSGFCILKKHYHNRPCCRLPRMASGLNIAPQRYLDTVSTHSLNSELNSFSESINKCTSHRDVLEVIESHSSLSLDSDAVCLSVNRLIDTFYGSLDSIPWLQRNRDIAFIQLLLSHELGPRSQEIWEHAGLRVLMSGVSDTCDKMTTKQLTETLLKLIYTGMNTTMDHEDVLIRMLFLCQDRIPAADLYELAMLTNIHSRMFMHDWSSIKAELQRFAALINDSELDMTPETTLNIGRIILNCLAFPLADHNEHIVHPTRLLVNRIEEGGCLEDPDHISMYLRLARKLFMHSKGDQLPARHLISLASEACVRNIHLFDYHNVAEACAALRQSRCYSKDLMTMFSARSVELLNENSKLSDVSNLFYAVGRSSPFEVKKTFENALYQRLQDVDVVLLSNLSENFVTVNVNNEELLNILHHHIANLAENLAAYTTRFNKVVRLLLRRHFKDPDHEAKFTKSVLAEFDRQFKVSNLAMFCVYLLPSAPNALDDDIYNRILKAIPKLKSYDHHRMALAINQIRNPTAQFRKQVATIQSVLHEWIIIKSDEVQTLDYLFQLTLEMVVNNRKRDPTLTHHFMEMYPKFTKSLTDVGMSKVLNVFSELCYYMPEVYDDVTAFALENEVESEKLSFLLSSLARIGYTPARFDEMVKKLLVVFDNFGEAGNTRGQILTMKNLNLLNVYPEDKLTHIFSIDFIENVDKYIEDNPRSRNELEKTMMMLNRNVVLECPQLDIPWFHEQYMNTHLNPESDRVSFAQKFKDEVEKVLLDPELLDNENNLRRWAHSPYGYPINFEFILDEDKNVIPVVAYDERALPSNMQRVAVLTLTEHSYTYNLRRLLGQEQLRWRHLEILGYKVIDIPYFEWYSMGLSDYMAKVEYLSSKVFDS